jgi:two-component system, NtrC family, response regulator
MNNTLPNILVLSEVENVRFLARNILEDIFQVYLASSNEDALGILEQKIISVVFLDLKNGSQDLVDKIKSTSQDTEVVILAQPEQKSELIRCLRGQASDHIFSPWDPELLRACAQKAAERSNTALELRVLKEKNYQENDCDEIYLDGQNQQILEIKEKISKIAPLNSGVLIVGEFGTGREQAARLIHSLSPEKKETFFVLACARINPQELEEKLFGFEKVKSFQTTQIKLGAFELASRGTLFIKDADLLPGPVQKKLFQVLEEKFFRRVGGKRLIPLNARIMASVKPEIRSMIKNGLFLEELYWRLAETMLDLPTLRDRDSDKEKMFRIFIEKTAREFRRPVPLINQDIINAVVAHDFSANLSELKILARIAFFMNDQEKLSADVLPVRMTLNLLNPEERSEEKSALKTAVHKFERLVLLRVLKEARFNQSRASELLNIHRNTLILKMKELNIPNKRLRKKSESGQSGDYWDVSMPDKK